MFTQDFATSSSMHSTREFLDAVYVGTSFNTVPSTELLSVAVMMPSVTVNEAT